MQRILRWRGQSLQVGGRAFELLAVLAARSGMYVTTDALTRSVWPGRVVEPHNLRMQINRLRQVLGAEAITNSPGRGYRLEIPVLRSPGSNALRLIGREGDLTQLVKHLRSTRLLTVTGAGGIGKTSLVRTWFDGLLIGIHQGAAWVDLTAATAAQVPALVATAVGLSEATHPWTLGTLTASLPPRKWWLVFDNAEHLAEPIAEITLTLLQALPDLRIIVTSQIPLRLSHEQVLRLGPLEVPALGISLQQAQTSPALALLTTRVTSLDPHFRLDDTQLADAVTLCRSLDGLPLAIELAAARIPVLGLHKLVESLDERLLLLHNSAHGLPKRHQTLRTALEWTHSLLKPAAQTAYARLGVFAGSFSLESAVAVIADAPGDGTLDRLTLMDALQSLVDASLVARLDDSARRGDGHSANSACYHLLESPRLFALERLHALNQQDLMRQRHLAWCLRWVDGASVHDLRREQTQLQAALDWALSGGDPAAGAQLAGRLMRHPEIAALKEPSPPDSISRFDTADDTLLRLLARLKRAGVQQQAQDAGLTGDALLALARRLRPAERRTLDGAVQEVGDAIELARSALSTSTSPANGDEFVSRVLADVAQCTRRGQFDAGSDLINEALAELKRGEAQRRAAYLESMHRLLDSGVQQDLLRRDAFAVARRMASLIELNASDRHQRLAAWRQRETQAMALGQAGSGTLWLEVAAEMARARLAGAESIQERASARLALARAMGSLGDRGKGPEYLQEAARTCRDALAEIRQDQDPETWGELQHELACALALMGMRSGEKEKLLSAVQCAEAALAVRTRAHAPMAWSSTQHVRGVALSHLGLLEPGTIRLQQAVSVLNEALLELTPGRAPVARARTLNTLGSTLSLWASREPGPQRHREALTLYQAALALLDRQAHPTLWANVCNNIGIEYTFLGSAGIEPETHWQAAIDAYRRALSASNRDNVPSAWARAQHNLGESLAQLGSHLADPDMLEQAETAFRRSLLENTREHNRYAWAASKSGLGNALRQRGRLKPGSAGAALLREAVEHLQKALEVRTPDSMPNEWLRTSGDLSICQAWLGQHTDDEAQVRTALETQSILLQQPLISQMPTEYNTVALASSEAKDWLEARSLRP